MIRWIKTVLGMISKKALVKYYPTVLSFLLNKLFTALLRNKKSEKVLEVLTEVHLAVDKSVECYKNDGKFDDKEIILLQNYWEEVFK
jgi:hypothetical protein